MLIIRTTGLEEYAPGGAARVKVLCIGGPGVGKTRWSSYFPKPIFADCEKGLASVADRKVPYASIRTSQDMLDLLAKMKQECQQPTSARRYETFVVDTLDAFARKVKNEWMELNKKEVFTGWEAWGYLNSKMQLLMTRLLNLDMNVIVNCHYKDKSTKDDESGRESHQFMLQLQGELADTAYNDFDLVGWMDTYWEAVDGERVQKRGITFRATPDKPMLKDRLHCTPRWLEVAFEPDDYTRLFDAIQSRIGEMADGSVVDEVAPAGDSISPFVVQPGLLGSGAMPANARPEVKTKSVPLAQMDKPTLARLARERGVTTTTNGEPIRGNTLKSELIEALEAAHATPTTAAATAPQPAQQSAAAAPAQPPAPEPVKPPEPAPPAANPRRTKLASGGDLRKTTATEAGVVDTATGEILHQEAVSTIADSLGGTVVEDTVTPAVPETAPQAQPPVEPAPAVAPPARSSSAAPAAGDTCADCNKPLKGEDPDFVKLSWIKFRAKTCESCYQERKNKVMTRA